MTFTKHPAKITALAGLLAALFYGRPALAQQGQFTLKQAINYSLARHPSNTTYRNDIQVAKWRANESLAGYLPQVNGTGAFDDNLKRQVTVIPAGIFSPKDIQVAFGNQYNTNVYGEIDQVIYDQSQLNGLKAITPNLQLAQLRKQQNDDQLIYNTANAYYNVLISKEQLRLLKENEKRLTSTLNIQKLQYEKGVIKKVDYDRVEVNYNSIISQEKVAETNIALSLNQLKNAMGMPMDSNISIIDSLSSSNMPPLFAATSYDIKNTWDYKIMQTNVQLQQIDYSSKQALRLPTLSAYGRYGAQAFGNDFAKEFNKWYDYSVVGLRLNVPVFNGLRRTSQIEESRLNLANAELNMDINSSNLKLQVMNANTQLLNSYNTLNTNKRNLTLAQDVLSTTSLQYSQGVASASDLLNSDFSLKQAQSDYINSLYNYLISTLNLQKTQGTLKQYANQL